MADPFSLTASVVGVATAAFGISKKLHDLAQDFREAPKQFDTLADQFEQDATLVKCTVELIQDHKALFKEELKGLLRDINSRFANINGLMENLLPKSRHRRRDGVKKMFTAVWSSKKLEYIMVQLEALRSILALIVGIARYAERRSSSDIKPSIIELFRVEASHAIEDCLRSIWSLHSQGHNQLLVEHRKLLTFDESPTDMAVWMAVHLSAPSIPTKSLPEPRTSVAGVKIVKARRKPGLPFGPISRAKPQYYRSGDTPGCEVTFRAGALDLKTLQTSDIWSSLPRISRARSELIIKTEEPLKPHEVDMIVGMDMMMKLTRASNLTIEQTPFVYLPKDIVLGRLLKEWTTIDARQIEETTKVLPDCKGDLDLESDSDGGATLAFSDDDETPVNKTKQNSSQRPFKEKSQRGPTGFSSPGGLAERFGRITTPKDSSTGFGQKNHTSTMQNVVSSHRDAGSGPPRPLECVPHWAQPNLTSPNHYYGPSHQTSSAFSHTNQAEGANSRLAQLPRPPPPSPPTKSPHWKRDGFAEAVVNHTSNNYQQYTPSMNDGHTTIVNETSSVLYEDSNKGKNSDNLDMFRKTVVEGESSETGETYVEAPFRDPQQAATTSGGYNENEEAMRARILRELEQRYRINQATNQGMVNDTQPDGPAEHLRRKFEERHQRYQDPQETYEQIFERTYTDLKRRETEERQIIEAIKDQVTAELILEQKPAVKKFKKEKEIPERSRRTAEADQEHADFERRAQQTGTDQFVRQFMDRPQGTMDDVTEICMIEDAIQKFKSSYHMEFDIMSYVTEEAATTSTSPVAGSACSDNEGSNETETDSTITDDQNEGDELANSDVERSQPWKGAAHLGNFTDLTPFYLRGSDAGQTWYHGADPVYIIELTEGYNGETAHKETAGSTRRGEYLLISKLWVDVEALDRFGFKYSSCFPSYFYLNPSLSWGAIETLVNFTFYLREVRIFRTLGQEQGPNLAGWGPPPPPSDFFSPNKAGRDSCSSDPEPLSITPQQEPNTGRSGKEKAEGKRWTFGNSLAFSLSILNFALHTIS